MDVTAPETQIVSGPAEGATITTASPVFVLTGTDNLSSPGQLLYQFRVDNGTYSTPAATPLTVPGLAEGTHSVAIRAVDLAGNVDATPAMRSFVAHVEPPNKIIVDGPPAWTPLTSVTYTFSSVTNQPPESIEYAWRLDGGALTSYTNATTATFSGLSESLHSFELHARDGFGLEHSVTNTFTVDHTAPNTLISGGTPAGGWASDVQPASFILTGTDNLAPVGLLRYAYRLDGDPFTVPALGTFVSFPGLPEGSHTFEVYAVDAAGTVDASPAARTFTVDLHTPETSIASGPVAGSTVTTAAVPFQWAGSDDQTPTGQLRFAYRADSGAYTAPGAGSISIPLADGGHTVDVAAVDLAGNADPTPASRTFTVDAHPPVISFDTAPAPGACITTADAVFVWSATDAVSVPAQITYATRVDGGPLSAFSAATSTTVNLSSEGTHAFEVQAKDAAGNVGALSRSWRFDVTVPTAYAPAMRLQDGNSMSIVCTSADNVEVVSYHIQIATSLVFTSPVYEGNVDAVGKTSFTGSAGNSYYCRAQAIDCAGNVSAYSAPSNGISIANLPDLVVTSVVVPPSAPSGQLMEVAWTVRNSGLGATNAPTWSDGVYLSPTPSYNPVTAVPLGSAQNLTFLAPTEAYVRHASYTLPRGAAGTYYILVAADQYNGLPESNGDNNLTASTAFTILPTAAADLVASDVSSPQAAVSGDAVTITWRVTNHGVGRSDASVWYDTVLLSDDDQLSYSLDGGGAIRVFDTPLAVIAHSGALEPDSGYLASAVVGLPASAAGSYHIIVVADLNAPNAGQFVSQVGNVFENNAELNVAVALDLLDITPQPPANLIAESATAPLSAVSGGGALVSWTVRNGGVHATRTTSWTDRVYLSSDANFNPGSDPLYAAVTHNGVLEIGGEYTAQANLYMPIWLSGSFYVFVLVDADNRVGEESEADNGVGAPSPLAVTLSDWPDLRVTSGQVPATTRAGNSIPVSWTVENDGAGPTPGGWRDNVYISPSPTWNGSARFVGAFGNAAGLASSDHYTQGQLINIPTNVSGVQYVYVITDADGNIFENADEGNNLTMIGSVDVAAYPPVDLRITGVTLTDTTASGRGMGVGWSGSNIGTGTTLVGAWTELVYLSTDQVLDGGDYFLGSTVHGGSLPPGAGYSNGLGAGLPNTFSGTFYAIVLSDPGASTGDIDMSNNVAVSTTTVTVRLQPAPDLLVSALVVPTDALSGQGFTAQWTVTNSGEGVTIPSGWTADFYLSTDPYLDGGDTPLGGIRHEGALEAGAVVNESAGLGIPGYASGPYFVIVRVDGRNEVYEAGRDNNVAVSGRIDATLTAPADLVVRDVAISPLSVPGDPVTITWTLANESNNPAVGSIENAFYVSRDSAYQETDPLVSIQSQFINLAPHASQVIKGTVSVERTLKLDTQGNVTATLPGVAPGLYYAIVRTNTRNTVRELALDNNLALSASPTQVDVEELVLGVPRSAIGVTGSSRYYRLATSADADVQLTLSSDQPDATNELYLAFDRVPRPGDFDFTGPAEFTAHPSLVVPGTQAGDYYVLALSRAVPGAPQTLTVEAHVLPFSISSITPNYGGQAGTVTCDLRGAALRDTTHVYLRQGDTFVAEAQVAFVNTTHLQVKWGLANVQEDLYDVVAVNGDSVATLVSGFRVQRPTELAVTITPDQPDVVRGNGTGYYTFRFRNESNQDMPHLRARLAFPAGSQLIALSGDARLKRRSDLHPALFEPVTGDADVVMDPAIGESLRVADLEAVGLSPGQELSCTVGFKNFLRNPYSVRAYAEGLEPDAYIDRALARIEAARQQVLAHPELASGPAVVLASDALTFAETAIANAYVATGLVSAAERDAYRAAHGGLVTTGALGPQAPLSLLNELALGNACSIPGGSPECRPNAAPTGSAIPACVATLVDTLPGDVYLPERLPLGLETSLATGYSVTVSADTRVVTPCDPNLITGPVGYGPEQYVGQGQAMSYRVDFSNDYDNAEAPAQVVKIVVPLDSDLDPSSFRLGTLGFGGGVYTFTPPSDHLTDYTVESNIASLGVIVRMTAVIDVAAQQLKWTFESLDPITRQPPASASVGFLPVNNGTHRGEGFATYTVRPRTVAATGTIVTAQAQITFDRNAPLLTNTATNRVDNALPASTIAQDVLLQPGNLAALHWHGSDTGTGVKSYAVYASKDASPFVLQASDIADTALTLPVESGHRYQFYTRATDNTNNVEPAKATGEAATIVPVVGVTQPGVDLPVRFALYPSFPNPFRRATTVRFDLPVDAPTRLEIFDLQGRRVAMPLEGKVMKAGRHTIQVGSAGMRAGVYFYRLKAAQFVMTRKMTLVR